MHITEPRQQLDHMLRETRIHLISFSQMADTKANILLSISSVLLSISLTKVSDPRFTGAVIVSDRTYEVMVKEIYYAGVYLVKSKYKYIRFGYMFFFAGLIISTIIFFFENFR